MTNLHQIKEEICDIGRRIYNRGFAAANDGNISFRMDENRVVCTPTGISKGFMKPDDLCVVDMNANQIAGHRKMTSEIRQHITIMKHRSDVKSVVHCHPPHATAFGIAREAIPQCILPEVDINMGDVPIARYTIPGGQAFADAILPFIDKSDIIVQANHGTVSMGATIERTYFLTEMLDAYCRILLIARSLGKVEYFTRNEAEDLLTLKQQWGFKDPRAELANCELCANDIFRDSWKETGVGHRAFQPPTFRRGEETSNCSACSCTPKNGNEVDQELIIKTITDRVIQALAKAG
ncbi:MAG: class II aldolase/adducin family protein [Planctomycetaceae bacterium]|jgi:L-fuculose-phosphate aldolase|nr:class II aldolase/adducin family protein [Planctomycetaceae bacterium]